MSTYKPSPIKNAFHISRRKFAKFWLKLHNPFVIGITGSQGKTTTSYILSKLFPEAIITDTNLDTLYNVPITALKIMPWKKMAIFELGIDKRQEMDLHLDIVQPKIAIVTGISAVHSDEEHLGSVKNTIHEKGKLVESLDKNGLAILNWDDENVRPMKQRNKGKTLYFGTDSHKCDVFFYPRDIKVTTSGTKGYLYDKNIKFEVKSKLLGKHQFYNLAAAYLAFKSVRMLAPKADIYQIIEEFTQQIDRIEQLSGRMSIENGPLDTIIFNDSLRANPASTAAGIKIMADIQDLEGNKIIVLGEMGELGELGEKSHAEIGELIATSKPDLFVGIGELQRKTIEAAVNSGYPAEKALYAENPMQAAEFVRQIVQPQDVIYLKGSLHRHMERFLMVLNSEKINCTVVSCPFYNNCHKCKYRYSDYANHKNKAKA